MIQKFTLHTHTIGFDGRNSPTDMIARATELGMHTIGISNHFILHPDIQDAKFYPFAVARGYKNIYNSSLDDILDLFVPHYVELTQIAANANIRVLRGLEVDFFNTPAWHRDFERAMRILRPDYIIGSCHFVEYGGMLCNVHDMINAECDARNEMLEQYWKNISMASASGLFTWLAHLDLPKKVGLGTDSGWQDREQQSIETLAKYNTAIEINTGLESEPYPSQRILNMIAKNNIPVLVSDDAHSADQIGRRFDVAHRLMADCGIKNFYIPECVK